MAAHLDHTHDSTARSWVLSANHAGADFPIQNLPFGVFRRSGVSEPVRGGVAIGDQVIDLAALARTGLLTGLAGAAAVAVSDTTLNKFLGMGQPAWRSLRHGLFDLLIEHPDTISNRRVVESCLVPITEAKLAMPVQVGNYSDFYTSLYHALNIGRIFGITTEGSNFEWLPIAYHGRASSIGVSGQKLHRPFGQFKTPGADFPRLGPTEKLDYELELAIYVGQGNELGQRITLEDAEQHIFGVGLLNDWSARDIQSWEMHPLGPFLAKSFATTISPWIVTLDALAPFRVALTRSPQAPRTLSYLDSPNHRETGALDIQMEVWLESAEQRRIGGPPSQLSRTSFRHQYWTAAQMVTHHTVNGCNLQVGDILGSGTVSGPTAQEAGALIELTEDGSRPVMLDSGEQRAFIEDGDAIILRGFCEREGFARIGFGESRGEVLRPLGSPG